MRISRATEPRQEHKLRFRQIPMPSLTIGCVAALIASIPQVLVTQLITRLVGLPEERAEIGPRFVRRLAERLERPTPPLVHWLLAGLFHFVYAAGWGILYGHAQRRRRFSPIAGGLLMAAVIYLLAFSRAGGATQAGSEPHPERRRKREFVVHLTPALTFSFLTAYGYEWLRKTTTR